MDKLLNQIANRNFLPALLDDVGIADEDAAI